jgi:acyl-coenzyme A synthetase/AMP-(fatty) acid ligase
MSLAAAAKAASDPAGIALVDDSTICDWATLDRLLNQGTNRLLAEGLRPGARVAVFAHNAFETALAYLSCLHAGVSSVPVSFHLTAEELGYILTDSGAEMLFVGPQTAAIGVRAARAAGVGRVVGWNANGVEGVEDWAKWLQAGSAEAPPADRPPAPHLHYTSGTTGKPKGTETPPSMFPRVATLDDFFAAMRAAVAAGPQLGPALLVGPLYHTGPLGSLRRLAGGKPLVIMPHFDPETTLALIERWGIDSAVMVPTHFERLLALPEVTRARYDVSSLRQVTHTGAACRAETKRAMIDWWGPVLWEAYGGTEAGTTNMITSPEWLAKPGSVGRTVPTLEPLVIDEDGREAAPGQAGVLYFRDPTGRGVVYHNDPEKTARAHRAPGVFTLGDIGYVDSDGYVFITDRVSDLIVSGGVNIYPAEIEQVLIEHPAVEDVAVIGTPNSEMGEEVKALVVTKGGAVVESAELARFCREKIAGYKCPRSFDFVASLGRNIMGKVNKRELRRPYWPSDRTIGG